MEIIKLKIENREGRNEEILDEQVKERISFYIEKLMNGKNTKEDTIEKIKYITIQKEIRKVLWNF